jgi:protein TonB
MELKKSDKADLTKKSTFFFSIGLLVTMLLTVTAFEWKQYDDSLMDLSGKNVNAFEDVMEVPPTEQPPPPQPVVQQPQIIEVPDEEEIEEEIQVQFDAEASEETKITEIVVNEPKEEVDEIFTIVEESAAPRGGYAAWNKYLSEKIKYPAQARRMGVEGKVFVEFVVGKDGNITDAKVIKGIGAGCDEEALRVVQQAPAWTPGKQRGKPVRQKMVLPITFKLG